MAKQQPGSSNSSGPCVLCRNASFRYVHATNVGKQERGIIDRFTSTSLPDTECICQACIMQVKRNIKNEHFHRRWLPKQNKTVQSCCIEYCKNPVYRNTNLVSHEEVAEVLHLRVIVFTVEDNCTQVPLCQSHYNDMYTKTHTSNPCDSCRMKPRKGELFGRHCPAPDKINAYLNFISNEPINLTSNSAICLPCYKYFNVILKQVHDQVTSDATPDIAPDIDEVFAMVSEKQHLLQTRRSDMLRSEYFELIACLTVLKLATAFKKDEAMLLPTIHQYFAHNACTRYEMAT